MSRSARLRRLTGSGIMAILDASAMPPAGIPAFGRTLRRSGIEVFQLRAKALPDDETLAIATALRRVLRGAVLLLNDRVDLAMAVSADGVHLGQRDLPVAIARRLLGPARLIGLSAGTEREVRRAAASRPDYVSLGPVYVTRTKRDAGKPLGPAGFARLAGRIPSRLPVLAVGGIRPDNVAVLFRRGAAAVAAAGCWTGRGGARRAAGRLLAAKRRASRVRAS